jgi:DNA-directed RNA polymerase alpha subunit
MSIPILSNLQYSKVKDLQLSFELTDVKLCLANSIRRCFSTLVPTVTFDDTWNDDPNIRNIVIHKNTSVLHNDFITHRLSLIPICNTNNDTLKIKTYFDVKTGTRHFDFVNKDKVPHFSLKKVNSKEMEKYRRRF